MTAFVIRLRPRPSILPTGNIEDVVVFPTPGGACWIAGGEHNVLQVSTFWTKDHNAVGIEHRNPQVSIGAITMH
jgi:hypothetical protein